MHHSPTLARYIFVFETYRAAVQIGPKIREEKLSGKKLTSFRYFHTLISLSEDGSNFPKSLTLLF